MSHRASIHPSDAELAALKVGKLAPPESLEVERHLTACDTCCEVMKTLPDDSLVKLLQGREPAAGTEAGAEPDLSPEANAAATLAESVDPGADWKLPPELASLPRYHVLELLGTGGMGAVYKAEHRLMERLVALKIISPGLMNRPAMVERFRREVKAAARLSHPNIVTAYDADQAGAAHFLVMEFVEGISLAQHVESHGPLPVAQACDYIRQAALGLQFAAEHGMVHRDIKPHNLMLTPEGQVKILDFGLARLVREEVAGGTETESAPAEPTRPGSLTEVGTLMGTADFIAPEQAGDPRQADIRADLYSLGCTLYYLLAGHAPFVGGTALDKVSAHRQKDPVPLAKLRNDVPSALSGVLDRMMAKDLAQRYQTPAEAADALRRFTTAAAALRRRGKRLALAAAALAASLLAAALIYVQTDKGELIIEAEGDQVAVLVQGGGVKVRDEAANREYQLTIGRHRLRPGEYTLDVKELPAGVEFTTPNPFILKRGTKTTLRVTFNAKKAPGYLKDEALRWFPADTTFFFVMNMEVFPEVTRLVFLVKADNEGELSRRFFQILGRIDRSSLALVNNSQQPERSRYFLRLSGKIARDRVIDHFRRQWTAFAREERKIDGEEIVILHDAKEGGEAVALIGTTDLIIAGYQGAGKADLPVLRECLDLRAGRGATVPAAHAQVLKEIPDDAWIFAVGKAPEFLKEKYMFAFMKSIRLSEVWMRGTDDVEMGFRGFCATPEEAKRFGLVIDLMRLLFMNAPMVLKDAELSAAVAKTFASLRTEIQGEQLTGHVRIPSRAWTALVEKMADTPLKELVETPALNPANRP